MVRPTLFYIILHVTIKNIVLFPGSKNRKFFLVTSFSLVILVAFLTGEYFLQRQLITLYENQNSVVIKDRSGQEIGLLPNQKDNFARYSNEIPASFKEFLIQKEDQHFYHHFGINPWSLIRAGLGYFGIYPSKGSSTITQQLVKNLLGKETKRNLKNKIIELLYALSLETYQNKETILKMYTNTIYFGNRAQGLVEASYLYFNLPPDLLTDGQILQLLATISSPTKNNPLSPENEKIALTLAERLGLNTEDLSFTPSEEIKKNVKNYSHFDQSYFEILTLPKNFESESALTIDKELTRKIREIIKRNVQELEHRRVKNGAAIVIGLPENELLAIVGSPNPDSQKEGYKINMAFQPRPIGSTIKPFIYLKGFEKGLRPYTLVDDREYKYITAIGFPLYPKNFDYKYRGEVTLHYALSNSLNVPAVKVLEYIGLENFYNFLESALEFKPVQGLDNYQLGIALGALEMSLWDLCRFFTIFPNQGSLKEIRISPNQAFSKPKQIARPQYIQLINKILNDRQTGIEQFGLKSDLNLFQQNYALKTGTSRDFKDSWIIGYTPDFLVGVWLGNADNSSMEKISGQLGAGRIWSEIMDLLLNSKYNKKTPFNFDLVDEFNYEDEIEYGLPDDDYVSAKNILKEKNETLILTPHQADRFLFQKNTGIIMKAKEKMRWFINEEFLGEGQNQIFIPEESGQYKIRAENSSGFQETVTIFIDK